MSINKKNLVDNAIVSAFWSETKGKSKNIILAKKIGKLIWRFTKLGIFLFLIVLGLWGCVSLYSDPAVLESTISGQGFEFGLPDSFVNSHSIGAWRYTNNYLGTGVYTSFTLGDWTNSYGPFYGLFVYPGCALVILIMWDMQQLNGGAGAAGGINALVAIIVLLAIIRLISIVVSVRSALMSEKMQELNAQVTAVKEKYKGARDAQTRQMQQQEIQQIYRKNKVRQSVMFEQMAITLPIFLIIYRVVTILRPFKYTDLFNIWNLSDSPYTQIFQYFSQNGWLYLILLFIVIPIMVVSQILPQILTKKRKRQNYNKKVILAQITAQKKPNSTQNLLMWFLPIISVIFAIFLPAGVAVYWVINAIFTIIQALVIHKVIMNRRHTQRSDETKRKKLGFNF